MDKLVASLPSTHLPVWLHKVMFSVVNASEAAYEPTQSRIMQELSEMIITMEQVNK